MAKRDRISFDPEDPDLRRAVDTIAQKYGIPPGDVMNLVTLIGVEAILSGEIDMEELITDSNLLRYKKRLALALLIARFKRRYGNKLDDT
jgi:hypothetical protein